MSTIKDELVNIVRELNELTFELAYYRNDVSPISGQPISSDHAMNGFNNTSAKINELESQIALLNRLAEG